MLTTITNIYTQYSEFTSSNQMLGAVVAGVLMGTFGFIFKSIPKKIWNIFLSRVISSVEFNSEANWRDAIACAKLASWANEHKTIFHSRNHIPVFREKDDDEEQYNNGTSAFKLGVGIGSNIIYYKRNFYLVHVSLEKANETMKINYEIKISTLWYNRHKLDETLNDVFTTQPDQTTVSVYEWDESETEWRSVKVQKRYLSSVFTTGQIGNVLLDNIKEFLNSRDFYTKTGIPFKLGIMLYGLPGTGKTSLIKALSTELNKRLYTINLSTFSDVNFSKAMRNIPPGSIVSLEDIDCVSATQTREEITKGSKKESKVFGVSLSTILNTLDGLVPLDDIIFIMSTNHISNIDPALLRKGRSDILVEVKPLDSIAVKQYSEYVYRQTVNFNGEIKGCDLQSIVLENMRDFNGFKQALEKYSKA